MPRVKTFKNPWVPQKVFLTKGVGVHAERLNSFEEALRAARISQMNLVTVSSIVPPPLRTGGDRGRAQAPFLWSNYLLCHVPVRE